MDFIFMLTRDDMTIKDCLEVFELIKPLGIKHIGCKDVGVHKEILKELTRRIKESGGISYIEVVSTSDEACLNSASAALEIGVDRLLGGTNADAILRRNWQTYWSWPNRQRPPSHARRS